MLTSFEKMGDNSRIWIYQSDRPINGLEKQKIQQETEEFLMQWAAHGNDLRAASTILHDHFLIISIDEAFNLASGCSIDSSVHFVQELGKRYSINFFERTNLAFWQNEDIRLVKLRDLKGLIVSEQISPNSVFFENTIQTKGKLENHWRVQASETWLKRYFSASLNV